MQTTLSDKYKNTATGEAVESILRKCVHCGFCNATCPTYQILGDELDGPRGRIYQIKQFFEGEPANSNMLKHLDRCLTCRSCETTCPSGVNYSHLLEIGRQQIEQNLPRSTYDKLKRKAIVSFVTSPTLFETSIKLGRTFKPLLPEKMAQSIPDRQSPVQVSAPAQSDRQVLLLKGCVQSVLTPNTNLATTNLLGKAGFAVIEPDTGQCCGAAASHTSNQNKGKALAKQLIDLWWPHIEAGVEAILVTASGCGVSVKDFGREFANDPQYAEKAKKISQLFCDISKFIENNLDQLIPSPITLKEGVKVAVHTPCTLQHGLGINHKVENILSKAGYEICPVAESHLCCGSAGTYSLLQLELSTQLKKNKHRALRINNPDVIATANIGCQLQIENGIQTPVKHWVELLNQALNPD